ncbi:hypothetical protein [Secundilactobacillus similis]|uniref:hypothetical protein n=1 Tax=Secundilactobacillus similis TaxID=414682 RepID=UPI0012E3637E|nr:hypothetical protein [Secundilactobacillus similis]
MTKRNLDTSVFKDAEMMAAAESYEASIMPASDSAEQGKSVTNEVKQLILDDHIEFGYNDERRAFIRRKVKNHYEVYGVDSLEFHDYVYSRYDAATQKVLARAIYDVIAEYFGVYARTHGSFKKVALRTSEHNGNLYLDLCNENWEVVEITSNGWHIIANSPIWFCRTPDMNALPIPDSNGSYTDLQNFNEVLNFGGNSNDSLTLVTGWLIGGLLCDHAKPILVLQGTAGAGKSTASRIIRSVIDPAKRKNLISRPRPTVDSLAIDTMHQHTLAYDNFSAGSITPEVSDMLCTIATNQSYSKRSLYTDSDEVLVKLGRSVIINGIDDLAKRQDLLDRSIVLEVVPVTKRRPEKEIYAWFDEHHPLILGALLNVAVDSLKHHGESTYSNGRMVDWCRFIEDGHRRLNAIRTYFGDVYDKNRHQSVMDTIETNPFVSGILEIMGSQSELRIQKAQLINKIKQLDSYDPYDNRGAIPKSNQVKGRLKRDQPILKQAGITYIESQSHGKKYVEFKREQ